MEKNQITSLIAYQQSDHIIKLSAIESIVAAMEASLQLPEAEKLVKPLLRELEEAKQSEAAAEADRQAARAKLDDEKKSAIEAAIARVEKKFVTA